MQGNKSFQGLIEFSLNGSAVPYSYNFSPLILRDGVLDLAQRKLIFFMVAHMVLSYRFVLGIVLITQGCFRYC